MRAVEPPGVDAVVPLRVGAPSRPSAWRRTGSASRRSAASAPSASAPLPSPRPGRAGPQRRARRRGRRRRRDLGSCPEGRGRGVGSRRSPRLGHGQGGGGRERLARRRRRRFADTRGLPRVRGRRATASRARGADRDALRAGRRARCSRISARASPCCPPRPRAASLSTTPATSASWPDRARRELAAGGRRGARGGRRVGARGAAPARRLPGGDARGLRLGPLALARRPGSRPRARLGRLEEDAAFDPAVLEPVTALKLSEHEARDRRGAAEFDRAAAERLGVPEVLLTLGSRGAVVFADGRETHVAGREPVAGRAHDRGRRHVHGRLRGRAHRGPRPGRRRPRGYPARRRASAGAPPGPVALHFEWWARAQSARTVPSVMPRSACRVVGWTSDR